MNKPDKESLEQSIKEQCLEYEGILELLHHDRFDSQKYEKFYKTIEQYYEIIKDSPYISREIAGYLRGFEMLLFRALSINEEPGSDPVIRQQLQQAFNETFELMDKIYTVE